MTEHNGKSPDFEGDFDETRARRLIENLRAEVSTLKTERDGWRDKAEGLESSGKSTADAVKAAEERARTAERSLWAEKALRHHPSLEGVADLLVGDDEDSVLKLAERLAKLGHGEKAAEAGEKAPEAPEAPETPEKGAAGSESAEGENAPSDRDEAPQGHASGRPSPSLTPGHTSGDSGGFDPDAVLAAAHARR